MTMISKNKYSMERIRNWAPNKAMTMQFDEGLGVRWSDLFMTFGAIGYNVC